MTTDILYTRGRLLSELVLHTIFCGDKATWKGSCCSIFGVQYDCMSGLEQVLWWLISKICQSYVGLLSLNQTVCYCVFNCYTFGPPHNSVLKIIMNTRDASCIQKVGKAQTLKWYNISIFFGHNSSCYLNRWRHNTSLTYIYRSM